MSNKRSAGGTSKLPSTQVVQFKGLTNDKCTKTTSFNESNQCVIYQ